MSTSIGNFRLIQAIGFLGEIIALFLKGPGPATGAYSFEFTDSALALQKLRFPQGIKDCGVFPDRAETLLPYISANRGKITAGKDFSLMGDETDPCPRKASFGHMVEFFGIFPFRERASVLSQDTKIMWGADRSNVKFPFPGEIVNLEKGLLVLFRGQLKLFLDLHTAAYRHQEKGVQSGGTKFQGQAINGLKFMKVVLGERGIDLKGDTGVNKMQDPLNSLV
ncbi:MAG: hypothetical protein QF745_08265, partial [Planctomycetota bacterium]|nr:hypothetical protein [Planctomycetota bacterium]